MTTQLLPALKTPESFCEAQLIAKDFDGTVALSFDKSPNGIGVNEAHELAIKSVFGGKALSNYLDNGGLRNRAPSEIVQEIAADADEHELDKLTTEFIDNKLGILLQEIGTRFPDGGVWPRPTPGYLSLREQVEEARQNGRLIDDLILSSGHEPFLEKTYEVWGTGMPTHIVAVETIKRLELKLPPGQLVKPSPVLMDAARNIWRQDYGIESNVVTDDEKARIIYIGDDPNKDQQLAINSGIDFLLLEQGNSEETWQKVALRLKLGRTAFNGARANA